MSAKDPPEVGGGGARTATRGSYGMDGGYIAVVVFGLAEVGLMSEMIWALRRGHCGRAGLAAVAGAAVAGLSAGYLYSTGPGKRSVWAETLDELSLRGDEHVMDVGCGRGVVLILAAHRLPRGRAVGVDIWRARDQSGNNRAATERNAVLEGVGDRVEVIDADARQLPFPTATFDLVLSSLAIHNIDDQEGRKRALVEATRVLRPGGRIRVVDPPGTERYAEWLRQAGCVEIALRKLDWRTWFGIPGHHAVLIAARKPL